MVACVSSLTGVPPANFFEETPVLYPNASLPWRCHRTICIIVCSVALSSTTARASALATASRPVQDRRQAAASGLGSSSCSNCSPDSPCIDCRINRHKEQYGWMTSPHARGRLQRHQDFAGVVAWKKASLCWAAFSRTWPCNDTMQPTIVWFALKMVHPNFGPLCAVACCAVACCADR